MIEEKGLKKCTVGAYYEMEDAVCSLQIYGIRGCGGTEIKSVIDYHSVAQSHKAS